MSTTEFTIAPISLQAEAGGERHAGYYRQRSVVARGGPQHPHSRFKDTNVWGSDRAETIGSMTCYLPAEQWHLVWPAGRVELNSVTLYGRLARFTLNRYQLGQTEPHFSFFASATEAIEGADAAIDQDGYCAAIIVCQLRGGCERYAKAVNGIDATKNDPLAALSVSTRLPPNRTVADFTRASYVHRRSQLAADLIRELANEVIQLRRLNK